MTLVDAFELSWKVMKDYEAQGYNVRSPRGDGHIWMDALSNRNLATHTYDETIAEKVVDLIIHDYFPAIKKLQETLKKDVGFHGYRFSQTNG